MDFKIKKGVLIGYNDMKTKKGISTSTGTVDIPENVSIIGSCAFEDCALSAVNIPEGVKAIDAYAFQGCSNLESVYIPDSVILIGEEVFSGCDKLKSVSFPEKFRGLEAVVFFGERNRNLKITYRPEKSREIDYAPAKYVPEPSKSEYKQLFSDFIDVYVNSICCLKDGGSPYDFTSVLEDIFEKIPEPDEDIKFKYLFILLQIFEDEKAKEYIKKNSQKIIYYLTDRKDYENIRKVLDIVKD